MTQATFWWIAAGVAVAFELGTGTFYLLMIALGLASGAMAAHIGLSGAAQIAVAAIVGSGATALWHWSRKRHPHSLPARENRDVNLDIGESVHVTKWGTDVPGAHQVIAVEGNWLVLAPLSHTQAASAPSSPP